MRNFLTSIFSPRISILAPHSSIPPTGARMGRRFVAYPSCAQCLLFQAFWEFFQPLPQLIQGLPLLFQPLPQLIQGLSLLFQPLPQLIQRLTLLFQSLPQLIQELPLLFQSLPLFVKELSLLVWILSVNLHQQNPRINNRFYKRKNNSGNNPVNTVFAIK